MDGLTELSILGLPPMAPCWKRSAEASSLSKDFATEMCESSSTLVKAPRRRNADALAELAASWLYCAPTG
jgi:hypothetical protein